MKIIRTSIPDENFDTLLSDLWFIKTRDFGEVSTVDFVKPIAFSKVTRSEFGPESQFLELTVYGKTDLLETYFKDVLAPKFKQDSTKLKTFYKSCRRS